MGVAISGGGYRSMLTATGFLAEMNDFQLLDSLNYMVGLSGGSWTIMAMIMDGFRLDRLVEIWNFNDSLLRGFPDLNVEQDDIVSELDDNELFTKHGLQKRADKFLKEDDLVDDSILKRVVGSLANFRHSFRQFFGIANKTATSFPNQAPSATNFNRILQFCIDLHLQIRPKKIKGFQITFTDYWGGALLKRISPKIMKHKNSTSFVDLVHEIPKFQNFQMPVPIIVANCRNSLLKNVIFEFTPFEFGSWESILKLFVKAKYLGSAIVAGVAQDCYHNLDDIGFITATSSSVFNNILIYIWQKTAESSKETIKALKTIMGTFGLIASNSEKLILANETSQLNTYYAVYQHNPFYQYPGADKRLTQDDFLYLVDGGEDGENIPLRPLLIPERQLDFIFAIDSSSDYKNFANGTKLRNVLHQLDKKHGMNYNFPKNLEPLPQHPIALGCYSQLPIILYHANTDHGYPSNTSTFKITYTRRERQGMIQNGRNIFNNDGDVRYSTCLACLIAKKSYDRQNLTESMPELCYSCFDQYCYN